MNLYPTRQSNNLWSPAYNALSAVFVSNRARIYAPIVIDIFREVGVLLRNLARMQLTQHSELSGQLRSAIVNGCCMLRSMFSTKVLLAAWLVTL